MLTLELMRWMLIYQADCYHVPKQLFVYWVCGCIKSGLAWNDYIYIYRVCSK